MPVIAHAPSGLRLVDAYAASQPDGIAFELLDDGQQVVGDGRDLGRLRVGVRGEHGVAVPTGQIEERAAQLRDAIEHPENHLPLLYPVHRHVDVVAGSGSMQPAGCVFAARLHDQPFDVEEQVLAGAVVLRALDVGDRH